MKVYAVAYYTDIHRMFSNQLAALSYWKRLIDEGQFSLEDRAWHVEEYDVHD